MAEHTLETRIQLRYDTYSNWMNNNPILKAGEMAVATVPSVTPGDNTSTIGLKVGDGYHRFYELPWVQAIAADVFNWAKQSTPPSADTIPGLAEFIESHTNSGGGSGGGEVTVTPRIYQLTKGTGDNANKYYLQYKTSDDGNWIVDIDHYIDVNDFVKVVNWIGNDVDRFVSLGNRTAEYVHYELNLLDYEDTPVRGQAVIAVSENNGKISVTRDTLSINDLLGVTNVAHGGTGLSELPNNQILVGHGTNNITGLELGTTVDDNAKIPYNYAVKLYVDEKTAGVTGAMHYIGDATVTIDSTNNSAVDPRISGYDFSSARAGDVITFGAQEYVWTGTRWRLLGDEGSYAVKGSIKDIDIDADANIQQSKIANLIPTLATKVDKEVGKQLSSNDYTNQDKIKLDGIETGAQRNIIEHIYVNDVERIPTIFDSKPNSVNLQISVFDDSHKDKLDRIEENAQVNAIEHIFVNNEEQSIVTVNGIEKSVNINFLEYTATEQNKLAGIENGAQVNRIERIFINGTEQFPETGTKDLQLVIDQAALNLNVLEGARIPGVTSGTYEDVPVTANIKKLELARIAKTGNVKDLLQSNDEYVTLYCGTSTEII